MEEEMRTVCGLVTEMANGKFNVASVDVHMFARGTSTNKIVPTIVSENNSIRIGITSLSINIGL